MGGVACCLALSIAPRCIAQETFVEGFESANPSWQAANHDTRYRAEVHARTREASHSGTSAERIRFVAANGSLVYFTHATPPSRVIDELKYGVYVRANRAGIQLLARVVLPRSQDPKTGRALTTYVRGTSYEQAGSWQELQLDKLPELIEQQSRVLRSQYGPQVDAREAYIDQVALNLYTGVGMTDVLIDDLRMMGGILSNRSLPQTTPASKATNVSATPQRTRAPQLQGTKFVDDGQPVLPRVVQHRGESLATLKQLGFTGVRLSEPPTDALLKEAEQQGVFLLCPPPTDVKHVRASDQRYRMVMCWDLGDRKLSQDLQPTRELGLSLRAARADRPLLLGVESDIRAFSRTADVIVVGRDALGSTLELSDYHRWMQLAPRLARPGSPVWCRIATDWPDPLKQQWDVLARGAPRPAVDQQQLRALVRGALAAGCRGLAFTSPVRLDDTSRSGQRRAKTIQLVNLELGLIEPWAAGGSFATIARSSQSGLSGMVIQTERARLLLPQHRFYHQQCVPGSPDKRRISFVVPGVPESNDAYHLTPAGVRPLLKQRVAGGVSVTLDHYSDSSVIVLTSDPRVAEAITRKVAETAGRAAELSFALATLKFDDALSLSRRLNLDRSRSWETQLTRAGELLRESEALLRAGDAQRAFDRASEADNLLNRFNRDVWLEEAGALHSPASPLAATTATLPQHRLLMKKVDDALRGRSELPGGDFESLEELVDTQWTHVRKPTSGVHTDVQLAPIVPHSGDYCLRLRAEPEGRRDSPHLIESPPVWITSPQMPADEGQTFLIHGWVRIPKPVTGSVDGLLIMDSFGGLPLAQRIGSTNGWTEFTMIRAATHSGSWSLTFALSGIGDAFIDNVTVQALEPVELRSEPRSADARQSQRTSVE